MVNEENKVESKFWDLMRKPSIFASYTFALSLITAGTFYGIVYLMQKLCNSASPYICSPFLQLSHVPITIFDWVVYFVVFSYTFKFKEKMLFGQIFKISIYYTLFVFIRMCILWNYTKHSEPSFYIMLDLVASILTITFTLIGNIIIIKIMNLICLKWITKHKELSN